MFGKSITLFKMFGFSVRIDLSWLVILVLVVWSLAAGVFKFEYPNQQASVYWTMGVCGAFGLFVSIIFHELCHSLVARRYGLPMTGITLFIFGGVAEMADEPPSPKAEFMMAIAGPLASVVVALVFLVGSRAAGILGAPGTVVGVVKWIGWINAILAAFNLIPGFPLDGGRVLRSILWHFKRDLRKATRIASQVGLTFGAVLIALGVLSFLLGNVIGGVWWVLIGMFLRHAAGQGYQQVLIRQALQGEPIRRFMNAEPVVVPSSISLEDLVDKYVYKYHHKMFPVVDGGRLAGCITTREVKAVPRHEWPQRAVSELTQACSEQNTIAPDADAMSALETMNRNRSSRLMVVEDGDRLVGILSLKDLFRLLSLKLELEGEEGSGTPQEISSLRG